MPDTCRAFISILGGRTCPGVEAAADAAFVLVAGGLGERLGYSGIKLALPSESATGTCFLQARCPWPPQCCALKPQAREVPMAPPMRVPRTVAPASCTHVGPRSFRVHACSLSECSNQTVRTLTTTDDQSWLSTLALDPPSVCTAPSRYGI